MKAWTLRSGRPIGRHNIVYLVKPEQQEIIDPWTPVVEEWNSVEEAVKAVLDFISPEYAMEHKGIFENYYKKFKFVTHLDEE